MSSRRKTSTTSATTWTWHEAASSQLLRPDLSLHSSVPINIYNFFFGFSRFFFPFIFRSILNSPRRSFFFFFFFIRLGGYIELLAAGSQPPWALSTMLQLRTTHWRFFVSSSASSLSHFLNVFNDTWPASRGVETPELGHCKFFFFSFGFLAFGSQPHPVVSPLAHHVPGT